MGEDAANCMLRMSQAAIQTFHAGVNLLAHSQAKSEPATNLKTKLAEHQRLEMPKADNHSRFKVQDVGLGPAILRTTMVPPIEQEHVSNCKAILERRKIHAQGSAHSYLV